MPRPVVSQVAEDLYVILNPLAFADEENDWHLLVMSEACIGALQLVNDYVLGPDVPSFSSEPPPVFPNWAALVDIDRCPCEGLPWLAQLVGVEVPPKLDPSKENDEEYCLRLRDHIRHTPGFGRGTPAAILAATQLHLTDTKAVIMRERWGGAYRLSIRTKTAETPDAVQTLADILTQKPAGIVLDYAAVDGQEWQQLYEDYANWQAVFVDYTTWQDVLQDTP